MSRALSALLLSLAVSPVLAFDLQSLDKAGVSEIAVPAARESAPQAIPATEAKAAYQHVWMSVRGNPALKEAQANDYGARIEARVREDSAGSFSVNLRTDIDYAWASIRKSGSYYSLSGSGLHLTMNGSGNSFFLSGSVMTGGKTDFISVNISRRFDDFSYNVSGSGVSLYTDSNSINGSYDPDRTSKKAVAAVTSMILALQVEKAKPAKEQPAPSDQPR